MSKSFVFILGATAGAVATLFFQSERGKQIIQNFVSQYDDRIIKFSTALKEKVDAVDNSVKEGIDKAAYKAML